MHNPVMAADVVRYEISNWVAWCWQGQMPGPTPPWHAGSAEGKYRPQSVLGREDTVREPPRVVHVAHARRVQKVFESLPPVTRRVVWFEYLQRRSFDVWEHGEELGPDGKLRPVAVRVANTRRKTARRELKIDRHRYKKHVQAFCQCVQREFAA